MVERRPWGLTVGGVVGLLAVANVMSNRVLSDGWYVPWNLAVAAGLLALVRGQLTADELGLREWRRGAVFGIVLFVATVVVMAVAVLMPVFRELFEDRRVEDGVGRLVWQAGIRIPFGTVVLEEIAFRSVVPALLAERWGVLRGSLGASALFGLWHVLPAWSLNEVNPTMTDLFGTGSAGVAAAVVFAVVGTTIGGLWWCWIRYRARSVLATIIAHVATNSVGYLTAYLVTR